MWPLFTGLSVTAALWLTWVLPAMGLSRLTKRRIVRGLRQTSWVAGRQGSMPIGQRAFAGLCVGLVSPGLISDGHWWGWLGGLLLGGAAFMCLGQFLPASVVQRGESIAAALPHVCDLISVCLEAGLPMRAALSTVVQYLEGPIVAPLESVLHLVDIGVSDREAWAGLAAHPQLGPLARDVSHAVGSGLGLAELLHQHATEGRRAVRAHAEERARKVGVASVMPMMCCYLPAFLLLGISPIVGGLIGTLLPS